MRKPLLYILLVIFMFQTTSNFWVIVSFYVNQDYIAENECINRFDKIPVCYGKCVLEKKLTDSEKQQPKLPNLKEKEVQPYVYQTEYTYIPNVLEFKNRPKPQAWPENNLVKRLPNTIFHPPKLV